MFGREGKLCCTVFDSLTQLPLWMELDNLVCTTKVWIAQDVFSSSEVNTR